MLIPSILPHLFMQGNEIILGLGKRATDRNPLISSIVSCSATFSKRERCNQKLQVILIDKYK